MSGRRIPLSTNQNVANSPVRAQASGLPIPSKQKRSYAHVQREEQYGQVPPTKRQMLEIIPQKSLKSPSQQQRVSRSQVPVQSRRTATSYESKTARERVGVQQHVEAPVNKFTEKDLEEIRQWKEHHRARFPRFVFYFDHVPSDIRGKLAKHVASLGAREETFFSIEITHIVTTRSIPSEKAVREREVEEQNVEQEEEQEQVETINPSLLNRVTEQSGKGKLFPLTAPTRRAPVQSQDDALKRPRRNMDVLHRAREMGKKIWTLDKLQRMLSMLLEPDPYVSAAIARSRNLSVQTGNANARASEEPSLMQLLHNERVNGPSDRDHTVLTRDLHHFKGPYIYVYDYEEKVKPIMVREYEKVADKSDGAWPQFRTAALGRCPFVEDDDRKEVKPKPKAQAKPVIEAKPVLQPPEVQPPKPVTGKRSLSEMENGVHSRNSSIASTDFVVPKPVDAKNIDFRANAFTSHARPGRLFGGEPAASGVQQSKLTSAIRSQMISSTAATPGLIAGLSKEVHGLQRRVLERRNTSTSQDLSSRRNETSFRDESQAKRPSTLGRTSSRKMDQIDEAATTAQREDEEARRAARAEKRLERVKKRDAKPGYCENCQEKFDDFDEHIESKMHRKFADNDDNWVELDDLLAQLERMPKRKSYNDYKSPMAEDAYY